MLVFSCLVGSWMLTAIDTIYPNALKMQLNISSITIIARQFYLPHFVILAGVIAFYFLFFNLIVRFCSWLASLCYEKKQVAHPYHTLEFSHYAKSMNMITSYNIRNNPKFKNVIINLERYLDKEWSFNSSFNK